jgi:hypothetical protein
MTVKRGKHVQNTNIPKHASCLQQGTKVQLPKNWQRNELYVLNTKCYVWANPIQHVTEYHTSYFQAWWWLHHAVGMLVIGKD